MQQLNASPMFLATNPHSLISQSIFSALVQRTEVMPHGSCLCPDKNICACFIKVHVTKDHVLHSEPPGVGYWLWHPYVSRVPIPVGICHMKPYGTAILH